MNLNKLFPRLTIRAKLGIAFALLTVVPLVVASVIGTRITVGHLRASAVRTLEHDLAMAQAQTARSLRDAEHHVRHLAETMLGSLLLNPAAGREADVVAMVAGYLGPEPSLLRIRLVAADGREVFIGDATGGRFLTPGVDAGEGKYYAWRAGSAGAEKALLLPVEVRGETARGGTVPAVAILVPVWGAEGALLGVVVGEGYASSLFAELETGSPGLAGVTGLVDQDGLYLYHSSRKRDWASLLASRTDIGLRQEVPPAVADELLSGRAGTLRTRGGDMVSFRPLSLSDAGLSPLLLYRVLPVAQLEAPVRRFLRWVATAGLLTVGAVLGLATIAANQLTKPIYQLRESARRLARGEEQPPLVVSTNDELEDLARDFAAMAHALEDHRARLEELIAERTRAFQALDAELTDILTHSADGIIGLDEAGTIRLWNRGAEALFGYTQEEAMGRNVDQLIGRPGPGGAPERAYLRRELERRGAVVNFQAIRLPRDGDPIPVSLTETLIRDQGGRFVGRSQIIRDRRMQAQMEELMRRSERLATTSVMAAGLAHELNNPLAILSNRIECMEQDLPERGLNESLGRDLGVLRAHVNRLHALVTDLLAFGRGDAEQPLPVNLNDVVHRVAGLLEPTCAARDLHLAVEVAEALPEVIGDPQSLEIVCVNLVMNAIEATPAGGRVRLVTRGPPGTNLVELEVADTGTGIPEELLTRIFEPFVTTKGGSGGTGLGLAVCRSIVERQGGQIRTESVVGKGSRFVVALPHERGEEAWSGFASW